MKLALCSDLHLEFGDLILKNEENADVLLLSGDICLAREMTHDGKAHVRERFMDFFSKCSLEFPHVIYIFGNHEHYNGDFKYSHRDVRSALAHLDNIHILDKASFTLGDITFIGGTLWTDMNNEDEWTLHRIEKMMNDFRIIKNSNRLVEFKDSEGNRLSKASRFSPHDALADFKEMVDYIKTMTEKAPSNKFVVVGHHSPSKLSTKPQYEHDIVMNGGYSSDLSQFIVDHPQIKLWTHGHTHHEFDYMVGSTRIVCNPRGYDGYEQQAKDFKLKYIEV